jgi:hypothetical protein
MSKTRERIAYQLRCQPYADSEDGILLNYLLNHPVYDPKEAAFKAYKAFWKALAYSAAGAAESERNKQLGWDCINALLNQVDYIAACLELNRQQLGSLLVARGCAHHTECYPYFLGLKSQAASAIGSGFTPEISSNLIGETDSTATESDEEEVDDSGLDLVGFDPAMVGPTFS